MSDTSSAAAPAAEAHDHDYKRFEQLIAQRVAECGAAPLFTTDAKPEALWAAYLNGVHPGATPQAKHTKGLHYNCRACRRFVERFGGLVAVTTDGRTETVLWDNFDVPAFFQGAVIALAELVEKAKVTGVFLSSEEVWGTPKTGEWTHLSGANPNAYKNVLKTAEQAMAEKKEEHHMLCRGLAEFPKEAVVQAVRVLEADAVDRSEKTLGVAKWLLTLHESLEGFKNPARANLIWLAVAKAPPGWCHVRSTMIATLLDDVVAGLPYESIKRRWNEKMHPLQYQRPTTVSEGNLKQANKAVEKLGAAGSLKRRYARLEDLTALWRPSTVVEPEKPAGGGAFDHLMASKKKIKEVQLPPAKMIWDQFRDAVLPEAAKVECKVPGTGPFFGLVTAVDPTSPPILQWDGLAGFPRNPVSWYFHHPVGHAYLWNLTAGAWANVKTICLKPCMWQQPEKFVQQGGGVFLILEGARDLRSNTGGAFFPECLRSEFQPIKKAMEAYARTAEVSGRDEGDANGIAISTGSDTSLTMRVTKRGGSVQEYLLS